MEILVSVPDAPRVRLKSWRMDCGLKLKASVQVAPVAFGESILALSRNKTMLTARGLPLGTESVTLFVSVDCLLGGADRAPLEP